jgi:hypothetical protein
LRKQASDLAEHLLNVLNEERARNKVRSPSVDRSA